MSRSLTLLLLPAAGLLALGVAVGGYFVGQGFVDARSADRFVTVKGLAEREVTADLAVWPLRFLATGDDLAAVQAEIAQDTSAVRDFLSGHGLEGEAVELQGLEVTDLAAQAYRSGPYEARYIVAQSMSVRSNDVAAVSAAGSDVGALLAAGVTLSAEYGSTAPTYVFTRLNEIKPEMIAEATRSARDAAEQFAADSGSSVAGIRRANQGVFQILPRDEAAGANEPRDIVKRVRVVTTLDYLLED